MTTLIAPKLYGNRVRALEEAIKESETAPPDVLGSSLVEDLVVDTAELGAASHRLISRFWQSIGTGQADEYSYADVVEALCTKTLGLFPRIRSIALVFRNRGHAINGLDRLEQAEQTLANEVQEFRGKRPRLQESTVRAALDDYTAGRYRTL